MTADRPNKPFEGKRAVVFNNHLHILGGGEHSTLSYTRALMDLGFETSIVTTGEVPDPERIRSVFGDSDPHVSVRHVPADRLNEHLATSAPDVFVNHSLRAVVPNPAPLGLYVVMFPVEPLADAAIGSDLANLPGYQRVICISSFTRDYAIARWGASPGACAVLNPALGEAAARMFDEPGAPLLAGKRKLFMHVGRFNPRLHNKNQALLIETFIEACRRFDVLRDWQLALAGHVNPNPDAEAYHRQCAALAAPSGGAVRIETAPSQARLFDLLRASFGYVHGTGAFLAEGEHPERLEHFGIAVTEAMACGCVPLVYHRGGIFDVLEPGAHGFAYRDRQELVRGYARIAELFGSAEGAAMQDRCRDAVRNLTQEAFTRRLGEIIAGRGAA